MVEVEVRHSTISIDTWPVALQEGSVWLTAGPGCVKGEWKFGARTRLFRMTVKD